MLLIFAQIIFLSDSVHPTIRANDNVEKQLHNDTIINVMSPSLKKEHNINGIIDAVTETPKTLNKTSFTY